MIVLSSGNDVGTCLGHQSSESVKFSLLRKVEAAIRSRTMVQIVEGFRHCIIQRSPEPAGNVAGQLKILVANRQLLRHRDFSDGQISPRVPPRHSRLPSHRRPGVRLRGCARVDLGLDRP